jgi:hypothetical protein
VFSDHLDRSDGLGERELAARASFNGACKLQLMAFVDQDVSVLHAHQAAISMDGRRRCNDNISRRATTVFSAFQGEPLRGPPAATLRWLLRV